MSSQTYIVIASRTSNPNESLSSPETLGDYHRHEFTTREQAETAAAELEADKAEYGLDDVTYEVAAVALADAMNAAAEEHWCPECCETVRGQSCCGRCGVYFGEPCPACGAAGYHNPECPEIG